MPGVAEILAAPPATDRPLLIETFGGSLSPLTDDTLQAELVRSFRLPVVLVGSSAVGAVGRVPRPQFVRWPTSACARSLSS